MSKLIVYGGRRRMNGGRLVTSAGGAPCCCGDEEPIPARGFRNLSLTFEGSRYSDYDKREVYWSFTFDGLDSEDFTFFESDYPGCVYPASGTLSVIIPNGGERRFIADRLVIFRLTNLGIQTNRGVDVVFGGTYENYNTSGDLLSSIPYTISFTYYFTPRPGVENSGLGRYYQGPIELPTTPYQRGATVESERPGEGPYGVAVISARYNPPSFTRYLPLPTSNLNVYQWSLVPVIYNESPVLFGIDTLISTSETYTSSASMTVNSGEWVAEIPALDSCGQFTVPPGAAPADNPANPGFGSPSLTTQGLTPDEEAGIGSMLAEAIKLVSAGTIKPCSACEKRRRVLNRFGNRVGREILRRLGL